MKNKILSILSCMVGKRVGAVNGVRLAICAILQGRPDANAMTENRANRKPDPDLDLRLISPEVSETPPCATTT